MTAVFGVDLFRIPRLLQSGSGVLFTQDGTNQSLIVSATGPIATVQTDFIAGIVATVANQDYRIVVNIPYAVTISAMTTRATSGTCTLTGKINSTPLGGTANSVTSSEQTQTHSTANAAAIGDDIVLTASANAACVGMSFQITFTRVLA